MSKPAEQEAPPPIETVVAMPAMMRSAEVRAQSFNEADNTIEVVWTTGAKVRRYDWRSGTYFDEVLIVTPAAVRLERLNAGAPLLDTHSTWQLGDVIGAVVPGTAKIARGIGTARVKLSSAAGDADTVQKIKDGIIRNISAGYLIHRVEKHEPGEEGGIAEWRVVDWEPTEISAVPVPADPGAQIRSTPDKGDGETLNPCTIVETRSAAAAAATQENEMSKPNPAAAGQRGNDAPADPVVTPPAPSPAAAPAPAAPAADTRAAPVQPAPASPAAVAPLSNEAVRAAADLAVAAERTRSNSISTIGEQFGMRDFAAEHVRNGTGVDAFRSALMDKLAERETANQTRSQVATSAHLGETDPVKRGAAIENALMHRSAPQANPLTDDGRNFRGLDLLDLAREALEVRGINTRGMSKLEVAAGALDAAQRSAGLHSTSDFAGILANVANKTLRAAYTAAPQTFRPLVRVTSVSDFKAVTRAQLGNAPRLDKVNEHGEFERGSIGEAGETYKIATYGKIVGVTRQVIVNDDLEALTRLPRMFGVQAAQLESDLVWAQIIGNPVMADTKTLFHADHKNLMTPGAIAVGSVGLGRKGMALQTDLDGETIVGVSPRYLIVPAALETFVEQFLGQIYAAKTSDQVPESIRSLTPISDPRLDLGIPRYNIAGSDTAWYLASTTEQIDIVELAYLDGNQGVYTETRQGFEVDGMELKVRLDVGAKVLDHRGIAKNAGA